MRARALHGRAPYGRIAAAGGAVALVGAVLLPSTAQAAPSADKKFEVAAEGKILAKGAAVRVRFSYLCPKGWQGSSGVTIVEAQGEAFASGYGGKNLKCSGEIEDATFFIQANTHEGSRPFRPGPASIVANLDAWNPEGGPCSEGMPCPVAAEPAPPGGASAMSSETSEVRPPSTLHREFSGVITLE